MVGGHLVGGHLGVGVGWSVVAMTLAPASVLEKPSRLFPKTPTLPTPTTRCSQCNNYNSNNDNSNNYNSSSCSDTPPSSNRNLRQCTSLWRCTLWGRSTRLVSRWIGVGEWIGG